MKGYSHLITSYMYFINANVTFSKHNLTHRSQKIILEFLD